MAQAAVPVDLSRVEFVGDNILVGERVYRAGDVADIPTERLKELGGLVRSSNAAATDFTKKPKADK